MFAQILPDLFAATSSTSLWPVVAATAAATLLLATAIAAPFFFELHQQRAKVRRYLQALCRLTPAEVVDSARVAQLPPLPSAAARDPALTLVLETLQRNSRRLHDVEQAQAAVEARAARVAAEAKRLRAVFAGLPQPVLVVDEYEELVLANRPAEETLGLDAAGPAALASLARCERLVSVLSAAAQHQGGGARVEELQIDTPAGPGWYRVTATKIQAEDRKSATVAVLSDIGEQKVLQKRNAEFVSSVSHEMKAPLAGIRAYVELLVDGDAEDEATREEFLGVINSQADRLQRLVDNLLNLARIEAGVVSVNKQQRSLNELLEEALRVVAPSAEGKNIALAGELSSMYLPVLADRDMLLQAAINLLSNAIKYTHKGGRVTLRSRLDGDKVRFEVADTGVGLSAEDCRKVFEKFYRVGKDKNMAAGTGLGLPLAKHIVEDVHRGEIGVQSEPGKGSTFVVTLPLAGQIDRGRDDQLSTGA